MKLIDRYLIRQFTKNLFLVLSSLVAIYLLVDFFERVDNFLESKKTVGLAVKYLLLKTPAMYEQLIPVCILLAGIITLGVLNHHFEFMALKAGGICVTRIIRPLLISTAFFTLLTLAIGQWILPATVTATNKIWYEEVNKQIPKGITREGRTYYRGENGIFSFARPDPQKNRFTNFSYTSWDKHHRLATLLTAKTAHWQEGKWFFQNGQVKTMKDDGDFDIKLFKETSFDFKESPADFFMPPYKMQELSLAQLISNAWFEESGESKSRIEFHKRFSYIFLGFPLLLLGIPVLLSVHKTGAHDLAFAIPISCGMAFIAWGLWSATQSMAKAAYLPPSLASWSIHIVGCSIGLYLIRRQNG